MQVRRFHIGDHRPDLPNHQRLQCDMVLFGDQVFAVDQSLGNMALYLFHPNIVHLCLLVDDALVLVHCVGTCHSHPVHPGMSVWEALLLVLCFGWAVHTGMSEDETLVGRVTLCFLHSGPVHPYAGDMALKRLQQMAVHLCVVCAASAIYRMETAMIYLLVLLLPLLHSLVTP